MGRDRVAEPDGQGPLLDMALPLAERLHDEQSAQFDHSFLLVRVLHSQAELEKSMGNWQASMAALGPRTLRKRSCGRPLSSREQEILHLIGDGLTTADIARRIGLSQHTIHTHRKRIAGKVGAKGRDLMRWAVVAADAQGTRSI